MLAVRLGRFGIANIEVAEAADPTPAAGEVLIAAEAATINPVDAAVASGAMAAVLSPLITAPYTPGWDVAGRVFAVGDGVDSSLVGKRVIGFSFWVGAGHGTQSSLVTLPLGNVAIAHDDGVSSAQLTTVGLNGLTAWRAVDELNLTPGQNVVVTGAAGTVGGFALELLLRRGARVIAAVSERDRAAMLALGAAEVVAREDGDLGTLVRKLLPDGADAVLDTAKVAEGGLGAVRDGGRFVHDLRGARPGALDHHHDDLRSGGRPGAPDPCRPCMRGGAAHADLGHLPGPARPEGLRGLHVRAAPRSHRPHVLTRSGTPSGAGRSPAELFGAPGPPGATTCPRRSVGWRRTHVSSNCQTRPHKCWPATKDGNKLMEAIMTTSTGAASRVAVVTGGSRGIGRSCAEHLASRGLPVVLVYATNKAEAEAAVAALRQRGGDALAVQADVADERQMTAVFDAAERAYGGVDVVVNAAGKMALTALADMDLAVLDVMLRTNVRGTFVVNQQAAWRLRPGGSVVNFSSSVLGRMLPTYTGYAATKGAVEAMTFILASELRGKDVTVNAVAPGPTATAMFLEGKDDAAIELLAKAPPLERLATAEDIAEVVGFLTSAAGHWINGQVIRANGGLN